MITRKHGNLHMRPPGKVPEAARQLEDEGWAVLKGVLDAEAVRVLAAEITEVFETSQPDRDSDSHDEFRHNMLSRSALSQAAIGHPRILETIEPLIGEDCHVIANTAWRNRPGHQGGPWHTDAGPHVPRPKGVPWPEGVPYPIFAIGMHLFLEDCPMACGPTAVIPGSHRSGRFPDGGRTVTRHMEYEGRGPIFITASAGDAALFVSDIWHRGTPAEPGRRRFFLQAHYGRRDLAQRLEPTDAVNQVSEAAAGRATTERARQLIGLHDKMYYDG